MGCRKAKFAIEERTCSSNQIANYRRLPSTSIPELQGPNSMDHPKPSGPASLGRGHYSDHCPQPPEVLATQRPIGWRASRILSTKDEEASFQSLLFYLLRILQSVSSGPGMIICSYQAVLKGEPISMNQHQLRRSRELLAATSREYGTLLVDSLHAVSYRRSHSR